jgi:hypothetical protein
MRLKVFSDDPEKWQDVARRLRRVEWVEIGDALRPEGGSAADAALFDGASQADPQAIEAAFAAGRHIVVVGAPCFSVKTLHGFAERAKAAGRRFACVNPDRLLPSRALIKGQLGAALGSPELVRIHFRQAHAAAGMSAPLGLPEDLVGEIEQAIWLVGRPPVRVFATEPRIDGNDDSGRSVLAHLAFEPGMATIDYDDRLPAGDHAAAASHRFLSVIGSSGAAQADDHRNSQLLYVGGAPRALKADEGVRHLATLVDDFAAAADEAKEFADGTAPWGDVARTVDAVLRSLKSRDVAVVEGN